MNRRQRKKRAVKAGQKYSSIKGTKVSDILNLSDIDINRLSERDLAKVTRRLADAANKRIKNLQKLESRSPALAYVEENGGLFRTGGKNINELRAEFARARTFLSLKTSTLKGAKKVRREFEEYVGQELTDKQVGHFWKIFHRLQTDKAADVNNRYQIAQQNVAEIIKDNPITDYDDLSDEEKENLWDDLFAKAQEKLGQGYEEIKSKDIAEDEELQRKYNIGGYSQT